MATAQDRLRVALWNIDLERAGPGLLLRDILRGDDPQIAAATRVLAALDADILILTGFDADIRQTSLTAFGATLARAGMSYPHRHQPMGNAGRPTGLDADGDGRLSEAADAQGWGRFPGAGGTAILSRHPLRTDLAQDHSAFLWRDLPGHLMPPGTDPAVAAVQRLSSHSHLILPVDIGDRRLTLLIWHATPPAFDGPEDRNGRRNHDEAAFWLHLLSGTLPMAPPDAPFVLAGDANLDPLDGDGLPAALGALLSHPALQDPRPRGSHGRSEPAHDGDPALDTAIYDDLGGLRLDYLLPSADLRLSGAGVLWPSSDAPLAADLARASHHYPVWIDIAPSDGRPRAAPSDSSAITNW